MKKLLTFTVVAGMFAFTACGPSDAEKAAKATQMADSIAAEAIATEAMAAAEKAKTDSADAAAKEQMMQDSAHADSIAKKLIKKK